MTVNFWAFILIFMILACFIVFGMACIWYNQNEDYEKKYYEELKKNNELNSEIYALKWKLEHEIKE